MTQLKITLDESQVPLVTQFLEALHIEYVRIEAEQKAEEVPFPKFRLGGKFDTLNVGDYAYEDEA